MTKAERRQFAARDKAARAIAYGAAVAAHHCHLRG
jgi:hypothetical protein